VPIAFLSGDKGLCDEVKKYNPNIATVAVKEGIGNSTINIHPELALELIETSVIELFSKPLINNNKDLPKYFTGDVEYYNHSEAYRYSMYKGVSQVNEKTIQFKSDDYIDILRFINFCL
jgi:D-amino peptidase